MNKITHTIDLCRTLKKVLNSDQLENLEAAGGKKYRYDMTVNHLPFDNVVVTPISGYDLMQAIIFVQKAIGDYDSIVVVLGSAAIRTASIRYCDKVKISFKDNPDSEPPDYTLEIDDVELEVWIDGFKAYRGLREKSGLQIEPDEDAGFDIQRVEVGGVDIVGLISEDTESAIREEIDRIEEDKANDFG